MQAPSTSKRRTKVAVLVGSLGIGGAELDIVRNFPRLDRGEFDVVVVSFGTAGVLGPELERQGIPVVARLAEPAARPAEATKRAADAVPLVGRIARGLVTLVYYVRVTTWVGRTLRDLDIDVGHFFLPHAYAYGMVGCGIWHRRARTVMSRLSLNFYRDSQRFLAWIERAFLHSRVDIAIGNSKVILDELAEEGVDRYKLRLLYNGIDPEPFRRAEGVRESAREALDVPADAFVIVAIGNLYAYKGHADLIEACARAAGSLPPEWRLLIAGRDEEDNRAAYGRLAADRGLADNVRLLGTCDDVPRLLAAADLFVQPSHHEGLPNAVIEAMASSLPVIGSAVGGIPEAVAAVSQGATHAEETGWLVPPQDPEALATALLEAAGDPARRERMGERARARVVAQFSLEKSVSTYEAIYRELVS